LKVESEPGQGLVFYLTRPFRVATGAPVTVARRVPLGRLGLRVLMDRHRPNLDGWEATRRVRARGADTEASAAQRLAAVCPIIALTAAALPEERSRCRDAGMNDFLAKPVKLADLHRVLQALVAV